MLYTYEQVVEYLHQRINYERTSTLASRNFKLERMQTLLGLLDHPELRIPAIHIAGTKGKGSTAVMLARMCSAAGVRTGLFTSPHVTDFEERMQVDGVSPSPNELIALVNQLKERIAELEATHEMVPTFFEVITALGWLYFLQQECELIILEVGLGGRLDATNVCDSRVCIITNISRDHTAILGETHAEIAREKAGILKPGIPLISGVRHPEAREVIWEVASEKQVSIWELDDEIQWQWEGDPVARTITVQTPQTQWTNIPVPLRGEHQADNAALALAAIDAAREDDLHIQTEDAIAGLRQVEWALRIEVLRQSPTVIVDAAHNIASAEALVHTLTHDFPQQRRILILGNTQGKDFPEMLTCFLPVFETILLTQYQSNPRAVPVSELATLLQTTTHSNWQIQPTPELAWQKAQTLATENDLICITGSFFLAAELRELILKQR